MDYLLKASGLVILLFLFYQLFLKNETFFKSIRSYFLIGLILVISLPLLEIPVYVEYVSQQINISAFEEIQLSEVENTRIDWVAIIKTTYLIGVLIFSLKFIFQLISLTYLIISHKSLKQGNHYYIETNKDISPFSFFNYIVYNNKQFSSRELEQIINHEKAHAIQWHSLDTLLAHILVILLWFNPFVWLYKKAVQQNLEFLADSYALKLTNNQKFYQLTLLKTFQQNYCTDTTNNFYNSLIKKRITMLHKNRSTNKSQWKYALLIPLLTAFVFAFNTKTIAQEKKLIEVKEINELKVDLIVDKNSTDASLKKESDFFKSEFDINLSFKGIKRNSENEIIAIKIDAKGDNLKAKFENTGTEAIKPIKISHDSKNNSLSISNLSKHKKKSYSYTIHTDENAEIKEGKLTKANYVFVTSDGKKKTWTSKDGKKEKIIVEEIHKGDKDHVWINKGDKNHNVKVEVIEGKDGEHRVHIISDDEEEHEIHTIKKGDGQNVFIIKEEGEKGEKHTIKIKESEFITDDGVKIELNIDEDNASENFTIIKKDGKLIQKKHKNNVLFLSSEDEKPIIYVNGKLTDNDALENTSPNSIKSVSVLKGKAAIEKYGEKAKNGVIEITLKKE